MFKPLPSERYDLKKEFPVPFYGLDVSGENTHTPSHTHTVHFPDIPSASLLKPALLTLHCSIGTPKK